MESRAFLLIRITFVILEEPFDDAQGGEIVEPSSTKPVPPSAGEPFFCPGSFGSQGSPQDDSIIVL